MATTGAAPPGSRREDNGGTTRRSLVTTQPVTLCDLCGRRLLRGEHPRKFLGEDRLLLVCELCVPRAIRAQWSRLDDHADPAELAAHMPPDRSRLGVRGLLARLRPRGQARPAPARAAANGAGHDAQPRFHGAPATSQQDPATSHPDPATSQQDPAISQPDPAISHPAPGASQPAAAAARDGAGADRADHGTRSLLASAVDSFNASHEPRRIAGIARALGAPAVSVRPAPAAPGDGHTADGRGRVEIVAAWELCWYRWLVDPAHAPGAAVELVASGEELGQLGPEGIVANALASVRGALRLDASA